MSWLIYTLVSTLCFSFYGLLGRVLVVDSEEPKAFSAVYNFLAGFFVLFFLLFDKFSWKPIPLPIILLTITMVFTYGIFNRTEYVAKKHMELSLFNIVAKLAALLTFLLSVLLLKESLTVNKIIAALLILGANFIVFYKKEGIKIDKGIKYALIMSFFLGVSWTIDKVAAPYWSLPIYAFMGYALANIFVIYFPTIPLSTMVKEFKRTNWKIALLAAMASSGYYFLIKAFTAGEASKVILINSTNTFITIILAIIILKERKDASLKILAGILALVGVFLLK